MHLTLVTGELSENSRATDRNVNPAAVGDTVWALATPQDHLEHVYVTFRTGRITVSCFVMARDREHAEETVRTLLDRALQSSPSLQSLQLRIRTDPLDR